MRAFSANHRIVKLTDRSERRDIRPSAVKNKEDLHLCA